MPRADKLKQTSGRKTPRKDATPGGLARTALVAVITSAIAQRSLTPITRRTALKLV